MADFPALPVYQRNLLRNGGMEIAQRTGAPWTADGAFTLDGWQISKSGTDTLSVSPDTTHQDAVGLACAACTFGLGTGAGNTNLFQTLRDNPGGYAELRGKTVSLSVRIFQSVANSVKLGLADSAGRTLGASSAVTGQYVTLTVTRKIDAAATSSGVYSEVHFLASATVYIDNAMLVIGPVPLDYLPEPAALSMDRCERYYELLIDPGGSNMYYLAGMCNSSTSAYAPWRFRTPKAATPSITVVNPGSLAWLNSNASADEAWTAGSANQVNKNSCLVFGDGATGLTQGDATLLNMSIVGGQIGQILAEANP